MTLNELYNRPPERMDNDLSVFFGYYFNHLPEIKDVGPWCACSENDRVEIRYYKDHSFDERRIWRLCSAWFDGKPFMVMQNAGREGDDHAARFITDLETYHHAVHYVRSLVPLNQGEASDVIDPETDIKDLTQFYSHQLDGMFGC